VTGVRRSSLSSEISFTSATRLFLLLFLVRTLVLETVKNGTWMIKRESVK